ncbi:hypothetical protein HZA96_01105 [Candidatus Woesearchaeota archaeon]|nr:hypothetical protein [Candidatus Woesearchaeota archaeon]
METVSYPLRIPQEIIGLAKLKAKQEYIDQATALRQLLYVGAEEYVLRLIESGRVSIGKAAELLNLSIHDIQRLAEKHNVKLGATALQHEKSLQTLKKIISKK